MHKKIVLLIFFTLSLSAVDKTYSHKGDFSSRGFRYTLSKETNDFLDDNEILIECKKKFIESNLTKILPDLAKKFEINETNLSTDYQTTTDIKSDEIITVRIFLLIIEFLDLLRTSNLIPSSKKQVEFNSKIISLIQDNLDTQKYLKEKETLFKSLKESKKELKYITTFLLCCPVEKIIKDFFNTLSNHKKATSEIKDILKIYETKTISFYEYAYNYIDNIQKEMLIYY